MLRINISILMRSGEIMLVCHCLRIFDGAIRDCVRTGARSAADVSERCGAGTGCGGCRSTIAAIVEREAATQHERADACSRLVALPTLRVAA
jgi:bacterioferritin-associated ferredoxin